MSDPLPGLIIALKLNSVVNSLVGGRIYGEELPRQLVAAFEKTGNDSIQKTVIVSSASGGYGLGQRSTVRVIPFRVDLKCYGESAYDARQVHYACYSVMKRIIGKTYGGTRYYRIIPELAGLSGRDPHTNWPFVYGSYDVWASE